MDAAQIGVLALQGVGFAYLIGAVAAAYIATLTPAPAAPSRGRNGQARVGTIDVRSLALPGSEDEGRRGWRLANALMYMFAGAAMSARDEAAAPILAALIVQQTFYLLRQRAAELNAARPESQAKERPSRLTVRLFVVTAVCAVLSAWLGGADLLK